MSPLVYLISCLAVSVAAFWIDWVDDARLRSRLRAVAQRFGLHFFPGDRFNFAGDIARRFPVPGVADPEVNDLVYGRRDDRYFYVFRFDYTVGVTDRKQRRRAIVAFTESAHREARQTGELLTAEPAGAIVTQYETLLERILA